MPAFVPVTHPSWGSKELLCGAIVPSVAERGPDTRVCRRVCASHVWMSPCGHRLSKTVAAAGPHVRAGGSVAVCRGHCVRVYTRPELAPAALPPAQLQTWKGEAGQAGLGLVPQGGGQAKVGGRGQARALGGAVPGFMLPVRPVVATSDGRLAPVRKALPRAARLLQAESASPGPPEPPPLTSPAAPAASLPGAG